MKYIILILVCCLAALSFKQYSAPKIELPEEYKAVTEKDTLKGYYDSKGILHIEFNNKRNQDR